MDAKKARCWKCSPTDNHIHFPPGSTFQPNLTAVATGLSFINTLCTRSECNLPILMKNNKNHQKTLSKNLSDSLLLTWSIETNPNTKYEVLMS